MHDCFHNLYIKVFFDVPFLFFFSRVWLPVLALVFDFSSSFCFIILALFYSRIFFSFIVGGFFLLIVASLIESVLSHCHQDAGRL